MILTNSPRKIEVGNALMYGLANEVLSSALPTAIRMGSGNIHSARSGIEAAAGQGLQDTYDNMSSRAMKKRAKDALEMPEGKDRQAAIKATAGHHTDGIAKSVQGALAVAAEAPATLSGKHVERTLKDELPDDTTAQMKWATGTSDAAAEARKQVQMAGGDPAMERMLSDTCKGFDKTEDRASWFAHARRMDTSFGNSQGTGLTQSAQDAINNVAQALHAGVSDTSLFGNAADIVDDLRRALPNALKTNFSDEKILEMLHDPEGRKQFEKVIASLENLVNVHARRKTAPESVISRLEKAAKELNDALGLFDEVKQASSVMDAEEATSQMGSTVAAARWLSKSTARSLAGVSGKRTNAPETRSSLDRFSEGFDSPEASFASKKQVLDAVARDPSILTQTLASSMGSLPKEHPDLFMKISGRISKGLAYMRMSLPPGVQNGILFPNGSPPPRSALRDWATKWNSVFDPETVYDDIKDRSAVPLQVSSMKDVHPDLYEQLQQDVVVEVGTHFRSVPYNTKAWLDLLFGTDGMAGPMFSTYAATQIGVAQQEHKGTGMSGGAAMDKEGDPNSTGPSGLNAIQSSVTNKAG